MQSGKISGTIRKRSIIRQLHTKPEESVMAPSVYELCSAVAGGSEEQIVFADVSLSGKTKDIGVFAVASAVNNIIAKGARPMGVLVHIMLPVFAYESRLKAIVQYMEEACRKHSLPVIDIKAQVNPLVSGTCVYGTAVGKINNQDLRHPPLPKERDIVLTNWIGAEGTVRILHEQRARLEERFVETFLRQVDDMQDHIWLGPEVATAKAAGASYLYHLGEGGIMAGLWELGEIAGTGLLVDGAKISVRQETIEICEYYRLNPYQLSSAGCMLILCDDGRQVTKPLQDMGVPAVVLGKTTKSNDRVIRRGDDRRFIDRPAADELWKIYEHEEKREND